MTSAEIFDAMSVLKIDNSQKEFLQFVKEHTICIYSDITMCHCDENKVDSYILKAAKGELYFDIREIPGAITIMVIIIPVANNE